MGNEEPNTKWRHVRIDWWLTAFCLSRTLTYLVFMTYAAALAILQEEWAISATAAGIIPGGFTLGYSVSLVICSALADRIGPKPIYLGSILAGALFSLGFAAFASDYVSALILYTLVGVSLGGTYTTGLMILAARYPIQQRGMAIGFFIASTSLGYASSLILSGITIPIGGYKLSFWVTGLGPLAGCLLSWPIVWKTRINLIRRKKNEKFLKKMFRNRPAMLLIGGYASHCWELLGMWAWTPVFLSTYLTLSGLEAMKAAGMGSHITASFHFIGLLASFTMGMVSDRLGRAQVILMLSTISACCSFVFGWAIQWPLIIVIGLGLIYAFSSLGDSPVLSAGLTEAVDTSYMGAAFGLRSLLGFGLGALSPMIFGVVLDWSNLGASGTVRYSTWGWAFSVFGFGGLGAAWAAHTLKKWQNLRQ
ncbi:MAG: MFS transporter [Desulfobacterales bacterium]